MPPLWGGTQWFLRGAACQAKRYSSAELSQGKLQVQSVEENPGMAGTLAILSFKPVSMQSDGVASCQPWLHTTWVRSLPNVGACVRVELRGNSRTLVGMFQNVLMLLLNCF